MAIRTDRSCGGCCPASVGRDTLDRDVFVHISAVERAGLSTLNEGQQVSFDVVADSRTGKSAAENLRAA